MRKKPKAAHRLPAHPKPSKRQRLKAGEAEQFCSAFFFYAASCAAKVSAESIIFARTVSNTLTIRLVLPAALSLSEQKFFLPAAAFATPAAANQVLVVANILTVYTNYCVFFKILAQRSILTYCSRSISAKPRTCIPLSRNGASINLSAQAARSNMICSPAEVLINTGL